MKEMKTISPIDRSMVQRELFALYQMTMKQNPSHLQVAIGTIEVFPTSTAFNLAMQSCSKFEMATQTFVRKLGQENDVAAFSIIKEPMSTTSVISSSQHSVRLMNNGSLFQAPDDLKVQEDLKKKRNEQID